MGKQRGLAGAGRAHDQPGRALESLAPAGQPQRPAAGLLDFRDFPLAPDEMQSGSAVAVFDEIPQSGQVRPGRAVLIAVGGAPRQPHLRLSLRPV